MSAKTIFPGGNTTFLPALAGLPNTTPVPISVSTLTASGAITSTAGTVGVVDPNSGAITYNTSGLTLSRNISNGQDEYDIIAVNTLTQNSLNIYTSSVSVVGGVTQPTLALASTGNVTANRGSITAQTGLTATTGNITASAGSITAQTGLTATTGNITATTGNITFQLLEILPQLLEILQQLLEVFFLGVDLLQMVEGLQYLMLEMLAQLVYIIQTTH